MHKNRLVVSRDYTKGRIDPRIYSSFVEHMGRVVYSGIYEPGHPSADENGFRRDVLKKVKEMGVEAVRYPGGNFVSCYNWRDGIGPKEKRPRRRELAWKAIETNEVGTDEFMKWAQEAGLDPILAVNLGTRGIENAVEYLEYCNLPTGTSYSDLRRENGHEQPYGVKVWCLGNEMDGSWQVGHKEAGEYGALARETAKVMKILDPDIEVVVCGSSLSTMATFPEWERVTLEQCYEYVDYLALHQYYGGQEKGTAEFLAQSVDMEQYIRTVIHVCDMVKHQKREKHSIAISFDEWGVWNIPEEEKQMSIAKRRWEVAPSFSEQIYTMEDALLFASMQMNFLRYADRVKIACQSLLTNISACIMTERGGGVWVQPTFYPFAYTSRYGRGTVLQEKLYGPCYTSRTYGEIPYLDCAVVWNEEESELVFFLVNRSETEEAQIEAELYGFAAKGTPEHVSMYAEDKKAVNSAAQERVKPQVINQASLCDGGVAITCPPFSWNMVRVAVE